MTDGSFLRVGPLVRALFGLPCLGGFRDNFEEIGLVNGQRAGVGGKFVWASGFTHLSLKWSFTKRH